MAFGGGGVTFGGPGLGAGSGGTGVPLSSIIMPAYRIAGITQRAMIGPSVDMYDEAIPECNRLLASWSCDGHKIYTSKIEAFALVSGQKIYTIGPGADFDTNRPIYITEANTLFPTSPVVRQPIYLMDDDEWASIAVQDIPGAPPLALYYDGGLDDNGWAKIYLYFQPPDGYSLEIYSWQQLPSFQTKDDIAIFPPGYERALVYNLAASFAALNPNMATMKAPSYAIARQSLADLISLNSRAPKIGTEAGLDADWLSGGVKGWLSGDIR